MEVFAEINRRKNFLRDVFNCSWLPRYGALDAKRSFLNKEALGKAPFRHLKNPRIPCPWEADWKRQYFGLAKVGVFRWHRV